MTSVLILLTFPEDVRNYYRTMVSSAFPELTVDGGKGPRLAYAVPIAAGTMVALWLR